MVSTALFDSGGRLAFIEKNQFAVIHDEWLEALFVSLKSNTTLKSLTLEVHLGIQSLLNNYWIITGNRELTMLQMKWQMTKQSTRHWLTTRHWRSCVWLWVKVSFRNARQKLIWKTELQFWSSRWCHRQSDATIVFAGSWFQGLSMKNSRHCHLVQLNFRKGMQWHLFPFAKILRRPRTKQKFDLPVYFCIPFFLFPLPAPRKFTTSAGIGGTCRYSRDNRNCNEHALLATTVHCSLLLCAFFTDCVD